MWRGPPLEQLEAAAEVEAVQAAATAVRGSVQEYAHRLAELRGRERALEARGGAEHAAEGQELCTEVLRDLAADAAHARSHARRGLRAAEAREAASGAELHEVELSVRELESARLAAKHRTVAAERAAAGAEAELPRLREEREMLRRAASAAGGSGAPRGRGRARRGRAGFSRVAAGPCRQCRRGQGSGWGRARV